MAWAAEPPDLIKVSILSGEVTKISKTVVLPVAQLVKGVHDSGQRFYLYTKVSPMANTSQSLLCRDTMSPPYLQVMAWCVRGSRALPGQGVYLIYLFIMAFIPKHVKYLHLQVLAPNTPGMAGPFQN